jgi:hypothetical protein
MLPTLVACPMCERSVSPAAPNCPGCGHPLRDLAEHSPPPQPLPAPAPLPFACPRCRSEQVVRFPVLWQDGQQTVRLRTTSWGRGGVAVASTGGTSQTIASEAAAPPRRRGSHGAYFPAFVVPPAVFLILWLNFGTTWLAACLGLVAAGLAARLAIQHGRATVAWNRDVFPGLYHRWENTYRCGRCGEVYVAA